MAAASRSVAKKAARKTAPKPPAKSAKKAPPAKKPPVKSAKTSATNTAAKRPAPKAQGVRRGEAPRRAVGAKQTTQARGSGGAQRPPALAPAPTPTLTEPVDPATLHLTAAPVLHRILTCHVAVGAIAR